jgi:hypothetical protein
MAKRKKDPPMAALGGEEERPKGLKKDEKDWGKRLLRSKAFQAQYTAGWDENRRLIFSEMASSRESAGPSATPPWASGGVNQVAYGWGLYEGLETSIYVQNPEIIASARDEAMKDIARRVTQITNYDFDQMNVKDVGNLCLLDTFISGYGAVIEVVLTDQETTEDGEKTGQVTGQEFEIRRIAPLDILFDRAARRLDLSDSKYLFTAWYPTIEELREDPNITDLPENLDNFPEATEFTRSHLPVEGSAERQAATLVGGGASGEKDPAYRTICVWEVYDKVNHELLYLTDYKHYIIGRADWPANLRYGCRDLFPQTLLYSHPVPGRFYPRPEAELIAPQLREINVTEKLISQDSSTKFRKWVTLAGIFTDDQKSKITDTSLANAMLYVDITKLQDVLGLTSAIDPASIDISKLVAPIEDIQPKQDLYTRYQMLEGEVQHITGYGPAARGGLPSTRSAREAMMINQRQESRLDKRKNRIEDFYRLMAQKHIRFLQRYMSTERYAKIYPKAGQLEEWIKYGRTDISGDFEFDVVTGTSVPKTTEVKKSAELQLFQAISPVLMQSQLSLRPAFERLAEFYEWDGVDKLFDNVKAKAAQAAQALVAFNKGQVAPEQLLNLIAQLLMAELTPAEMEMIKKQMSGGAGQLPSQRMANQARGDPNAAKTAQGVP